MENFKTFYLVFVKDFELGDKHFSAHQDLYPKMTKGVAIDACRNEIECGHTDESFQVIEFSSEGQKVIYGPERGHM